MPAIGQGSQRYLAVAGGAMVVVVLVVDRTAAGCEATVDPHPAAANPSTTTAAAGPHQFRLGSRVTEEIVAP